MGDDVIIGKLTGVLEGIQNSLSRIEKSLYGNGQPGLMERVTRIEENMLEIQEIVRSNMDKNDKNSDNVKSDVKAIGDKIDEHIRDNSKHLPKGLLSKDIAFWALCFIVFINSLIPADLTIYELVKTIFGL